MKIFLWLFGIVLVLGGLVGAGLYFKGNGAVVDEALVVRIETIGRGDLIEVVQAPAEVMPRNKVSISARVAARIMELPFKEGDRVKAGDVIVRLDSTDLQAALRSSLARYEAQKASISAEESRIDAQRAQLQGQRANLAEAERDLERQKGLLASHDVSQSIVDTAQRRVDEQKASVDSAEFSLKAATTNLEVSRHNLEAADADIVRAKDNLSYTTITTPIDGIVTVINAKAGELVVTGTMNNAGTVILEVADLSQMLAQARVDETDVASVEVGQPVKVRLLAFPDEIFTGKVASVALARSTERLGGTGGGGGDAKTFKVEVMIEAPNRRIHSGLTADVEVQTKKNENVVRVPTQAVLGRPTDMIPADIRNNNPNVDSTKTVAMVVFRMVNEKAVLTPVSVGAADNAFTLVRGGLNDGDKVITGPYKALETVAHDQKLKLEAAPTTAPATAPSTRPN